MAIQLVVLLECRLKAKFVTRLVYGLAIQLECLWGFPLGFLLELSKVSKLV